MGGLFLLQCIFIIIKAQICFLIYNKPFIIYNKRKSGKERTNIDKECERGNPSFLKEVAAEPNGNDEESVKQCVWQRR